MLVKFLVLVLVCSVCLTQSANTKPDAVGFSGSGFLLIYQLGVLKKLKETRFIPDVTDKLAGLSGGALISALHCTKSSLGLAKSQLFDMLEHCASDAPLYCFGSLDAHVTQIVETVTPKGTRPYLPCRQKLFVDVSRLTDPVDGQCQNCSPEIVEPKVVYYYQNRRDLIQVLRTTAFISGVSSTTKCTLELRDHPSCDGGYAQPRVVPCPPNSQACVRVSAFTNANVSTTNIYPGMRGVNTLPIPAALWDQSSLNAPVINRYREEIYNTGYLDAAHWLETNKDMFL